MTDQVEIAWIGGNCPVQAEGTIDGARFYFRARGEHWSVEVGDWYYQEEWPHGKYSSGWMTEDDARACIHKAAAAFAKAMGGKP